MTCTNCGRYAPPDPETGYDADDLCPDCRASEEDAVTDPDDTETVDPVAMAEQSILMALEAIRLEVLTAKTVDRLLWITGRLRVLNSLAAEAEDECADTLDRQAEINASATEVGIRQLEASRERLRAVLAVELNRQHASVTTTR